jgi:hypothetical protein
MRRVFNYKQAADLGSAEHALVRELSGAFGAPERGARDACSSCWPPAAARRRLKLGAETLQPATRRRSPPWRSWGR